MKKKLHLYLATSRKRRLKILMRVLWLLRLLRDVEYDEMNRNEDLLNGLDSDNPPALDLKYEDIEKEYTYCEYTLGILEYMIDEIGMALQAVPMD